MRGELREVHYFLQTFLAKNLKKILSDFSVLRPTGLCKPQSAQHYRTTGQETVACRRSSEDEALRLGLLLAGLAMWVKQFVHE